MHKRVKIIRSNNYSNVSLLAKIEKIYGMHKLVGLQLFWSGTPTFSSGTPTFCQMGVLNSYFQNPSESSVKWSVQVNVLLITIVNKILRHCLSWLA